jgi:hypothetical protein
MREKTVAKIIWDLIYYAAAIIAVLSGIMHAHFFGL